MSKGPSMPPELTWSQHCTPLGDLGRSAMAASVPLLTLLALLGVWRVRAPLAALAALGVAAALATGIYGMPVALAGAAALHGAAFGLFPIGWVVLNAMFLYRVSWETGGFAEMQRRLAGVSADRRIQALLIAFCFGAFVEGLAGFGAPVAVTGALMIGLGFRPLEAAVLALIGNTAPVAFGSVGIPIVTLSRVTGLDEVTLGAMVGRQLPWVAVVVPFWLVWAQSGWRGMVGVWPACLVTGCSFAVLQFLVSNLHGPWLVDIVASLGSLGATLLLLRWWRPAEIQPVSGSGVWPVSGTGMPGWRAALPWICFAGLGALRTLKPIRDTLGGWFAPRWPVPALHEAVIKVPPGQTLRRVRVSLVTIALMLALGFVTRYSGTDTTLGLALATTGPWFPFFSPLLGWLGVALTGSDTSSNVLFGHLQKVTAEQLGLSPVMMAAANSAGGVMGKMVDAQSIVVASVATGGRPDSPDVGTVLRAVFWHSVGLALLLATVIWVQARWFPGIVPGS